MNPMDILYIFVFPSGFAVTLIMLLIGWFFMPPSAKLLIKKRFGFLKNKAFDLIAWDDRVLTLESMDVAPEGLLEKDAKKARSKNFYLAKPQDTTANPEKNLLDSERDMDVLPPYILDGIPINFSHISKAVATNPRVLTALRIANRVDAENPKMFKGKAVLPQNVTVIDDDGFKTETNTVDVNVRLPFDPVDIKKNFPQYYQQSNIDSTKRRNQAIGQEKARQSWMGMVKYIVIICAIALAVTIAAMVIVYFATHGDEPAVITPQTSSLILKAYKLFL